jgi:hypothetical protein
MANPLPKSWSRSGTLLIKSVAICVFGGVLAGAAGYSIIEATRDGKWSELFSSWAFYSLFGFPVGGAFGVLCGVLAAGVLEALVRSSFRASSRKAWLAFGGAVGAIAGVVCPFVLRAQGFNVNGANEVVQWGGTGAIAGVCCGLLLGWLGWVECRDRLTTASAASDA